MRANVEVTVRERVTSLLQARPDVSYKEFGEAIGRGYAWVYAFVAGTRNANDLLLLVKIARFFGVSVGYLIGESERGRDAGSLALLAAYEELLPPDRAAVLQLALALRRRGPSAADEAPGAPPTASGGARRRSK